MTEETKTVAGAETTAQAPNTAPQGDQQVVDLTVQDLGVIRSIIDVATSRGAFKANELEAVGKTFNKLDSFLNKIAEQQKANTDASAKGTETKGEK